MNDSFIHVGIYSFTLVCYWSALEQITVPNNKWHIAIEIIMIWLDLIKSILFNVTENSSSVTTEFFCFF